MSRKPEDIHAALAALADDTLPKQRREQLLAQVAESPELAAELENQRRAVAILRTLERVEAPTLLRRSIELAAAGNGATAGDSRPAGGDAQHTRARGSHRSLSLRRPPRLAGAVAFAAAVAVALVLALTTGGGASAPTVPAVASVGLRTATRPAPAESPHDSRLLAVSAAGISYPYWGGKLGWEAAGARTDTVGGRTVTTVFYTDRRARRIGYSIVSGGALTVPAGSAVVQRRGVSFHVVSRANPTIVTWREAGHTCILAARGVDAGTLVRLASWERAT
jgi:hypothetical protein